MSVLGLSALSVALGGRVVVSGVDLAVERGEWVGIIGPNGAGKTSILGAVAGIVPSTGSITVLGDDARGLRKAERAKRIALVPQRPVIPSAMRVVDYVLLGRTPHVGALGRETSADVAATVGTLAELGLTGFAERRLGELSGGELQKVVVARALAQQAPILLLDEPTAALDVGHAQSALALIDRMRWERGLTVVSAIHDLTLAAQSCDRLVLLSGGRIVAEGTARAVLTESRIREHYGAVVRVLDDGFGGLVVLPVRAPQPEYDLRSAR